MGDPREVDRGLDLARGGSGKTPAETPPLLMNIGPGTVDPLTEFEPEADLASRPSVEPPLLHTVEAPTRVRVQATPPSVVATSPPAAAPPTSGGVGLRGIEAAASLTVQPAAISNAPPVLSSASAGDRASARDATVDAASSSVTLERLLESEAALEWHDAVAVVQQLAEQIVTSRAHGSLPSLDEIRIGPDGRLQFTLDREGKETAVRGLGHVLSQLLNDRPVPAALRLLASQSVSEVTTIDSVRELMQRLAQFERPNRQRKLVDLYQRAAALPARPRALRPERLQTQQVRSPEPPTQPRAAAQPAAAASKWAEKIRQLVEPVLTAIGRTEKTRHLVVVALVIAAVVGLVLIARLAVPPEPDVASSSRLRTPQTPSGRGAVEPVREAVDQTAAGTSAGSPNRGTARSAAQAAPAAPTAGTNRQPAAGVSGQAPTSQARVLLPMGRGIPTAPPTDAPTGPVPDSARPAAGNPRNDDSGFVYSADDPGVVEPILVRPYLPRPADVRSGDPTQGVLELIIDESGEVESVRLQSPVNRYRDRWWVSVAKNWRFEPATKDGRPVKYRKQIFITDFPEPPQ